MDTLSGRDGDDSFVIISETNNNNAETDSKKEMQVPDIYEMQTEAKIRNRFAHTTVTSKVRNTNSSAKETTFFVILPEKAFISEFVMIIGQKSYKARVEKKEEAQHIYDEAVKKGATAGQVGASARDSNRFDVSVNVEPLSSVTFQLTYEELLKRKENLYELVINIHPKQIVENLVVNVFIDESRPLTFIKTPALRSGKEIIEETGDLDPKAEINQFSATGAVIRFKPCVERQREIATIFGSKIEEGFAGQFVAQYDVERDPNGGEVLVQDGYFIHFFAPDNIKPLNKYIIFVLDISTSMCGQKIEQLKQAMHTILQQLDKEDYFHIICFQTQIEVWDIQELKQTIPDVELWPEFDSEFEKKHFHELSNCNFPPASAADQDNVLKARGIIEKLEPTGCTNIYDALRIALFLIQKEKENTSAHKYLPQPMIIFLTDGEPTTGVQNKNTIISDITKFNDAKASIFTLTFGEDADKVFLKMLAQKNHAFSRHIYEASDAALQLQNFYKEVASPLLSNVTFEYMPDATSLTKTTFPLYFYGSEIVVSGRFNGETFPGVPRVKCCGRTGPVVLQPVLQRPVTSLERLWAYLTVQQLLDESEISPDKSVVEQKALDLALQYSFVTPLTSLVVVKPDSNDFSVDPESADSKGDEHIPVRSVLSRDVYVEELPEMCDVTELVEVASKRVTKKRVIKRRKAPKIETVAVEEEEITIVKTVEKEITIKKCNQFFLWILVVRLLKSGALFRVPLFLSLFFYFLIVW